MRRGMRFGRGGGSKLGGRLGRWVGVCSVGMFLCLAFCILRVHVCVVFRVCSGITRDGVYLYFRWEYATLSM